jgi:hypothetical protein
MLGHNRFTLNSFIYILGIFIMQAMKHEWDYISNTNLREHNKSFIPRMKMT